MDKVWSGLYVNSVTGTGKSYGNYGNKGNQKGDEEEHAEPSTESIRMFQCYEMRLGPERKKREIGVESTSRGQYPTNVHALLPRITCGERTGQAQKGSGEMEAAVRG
jgi:hypothetical protein